MASLHDDPMLNEMAQLIASLGGDMEARYQPLPGTLEVWGAFLKSDVGKYLRGWAERTRDSSMRDCGTQVGVQVYRAQGALGVAESLLRLFDDATKQESFK